MFYPGGEETIVRSSDGIERFTSYKITRKQMSLFQTSHATYRSRDAVISRDEPNIGTLRSDDAHWTLPIGVTYPVSATWQGGLVAPTYKAYTFYLEGAPDAHLEIDGHDFPPDPGAGTGGSQALRQVDVVLAKGMHQIRLSGTLDGPQRGLTLKWSDSKSMSPIKSAYLYNSNGRESVLGGLSGEVGPLGSPELLREADPFGGLQPETRRNDPFLGFREATAAFGEAPFLVRWRGNINITTPGDYIFSLQSQGPSIMLVDGRVAGGQGAAQSTVRVPFTAGSHAVDIRYAWGGGPAVIEWFWNTPDGNYGLVPTSVLTPAARSWLLDEMPDAPGASERAGETATLEAVIAAEAGLTNPKGIAVDADGNLYVGDKGNGRIVALSPDGKVLHTWGKAGNEQNLQPGEFLDMQDVAISPDGIIAVTDYKSQLVQLFDKEGRFIGSLDATATQVAGANGVAWPTGRNIYIADTNVSKVLKLTLTSDNAVQAVESVPVDEENKLEQTLDVAVDASGTVYAVDVMNRILRISPDGTITVYRLPVGTSNGGSRLAINPDGSKLYMSDPDRKRVAILDTVSGNITYFGEGGSNPGQFEEPSGVAVGADGRIYVLDRLNNNIQVFLPPR